MPSHAVTYDQVETVEDLKAIASDPEVFLKQLGGVIARKVLVGQLRPVLEPVAKKHGFKWAMIEPVLTMITAPEKLEQACVTLCNAWWYVTACDGM